MKIKERLTNKDAWIRYRDSLRYALHCIVRPFDGFWDLTHEKRGSMAAANTLIVHPPSQVCHLLFFLFLS